MKEKIQTNKKLHYLCWISRLFRSMLSNPSSFLFIKNKFQEKHFSYILFIFTFQAIALVDIVKKFNWTYVSTIASEGSYGELIKYSHLKL